MPGPLLGGRTPTAARNARPWRARQTGTNGLLTGDPNATLGAALNQLQQKMGMHGALKSALSSLYGYTSGEQGIRHAMLDEPNLTSSEAKFMLVVCSAFTNYIVSKAAEAGLKL